MTALSDTVMLLYILEASKKSQKGMTKHSLSVASGHATATSHIASQDCVLVRAVGFLPRRGITDGT